MPSPSSSSSSTNSSRVIDLVTCNPVDLSTLDFVTRYGKASGVNQRLKGDLQPDNIDALAAMLSIRAALNSQFVYLFNRQGVTVASTPYGGGKTLTGNSYAFRPYFTRVLEKGESVFYPALGATTGQRGLYVSVPLIDNRDGSVAGVVAAKSLLDTHDHSLLDHLNPTALVSPEGVVFASNRQAWLMRTIYPLTAAEREACLKSSG